MVNSAERNFDSLDNLQAGQRGTREEFKQRFGGSTNPGIVSCPDVNAILLYSDADAGSLYGYDTDGWVDENHSRFQYTGAGAFMKPPLTHSNNALLLREIDEPSRRIFLFVAVGKVPGSGTKIHECQGEVRLDPQDPYQLIEPPQYSEAEHNAVLFNLIPLKASAVPGSREGHAKTAQEVAPETLVQEVAPETANTETFETGAVQAGTGRRSERGLEKGLIELLTAQGHTPMRLAITPKGQPLKDRLYTDTWVPEIRELFEVKSSSRRESIRMAVAQLLDYRRGIDPSPKCTVIVPDEPVEDLVDFVRSVDMHIAVMGGGVLTYL